MTDDVTPTTIVVEQKEPRKDAQKGVSTEQIIDLIKWFIGTVVLGVFANVITNNYNNNKLVLERLDTDSKLITSISLKFDTLPSTQYSYLRFIKPFVTSDSLKKGIKESLDTLKIAVKRQQANAQKTVQPAADKNLSHLTEPQVTAFKNTASSDISTSKVPPVTSMSEAVKSENNLVGDNVKLTNIDTKAISNIEAASVILNPPIVNNYTLIGSPQTLYCKKGYYVEFNSTLRIGVNYLDIANQKVSVRYTDISSGEILKDETFLDLNKPDTLVANPLKYNITLTYIGAAGKNPFTKAAYLTVATYKK